MMAGLLARRSLPWITFPGERFENDAALIAYLTGVIGGAKIDSEIAPPVVYPKHGFYHPDAPKLAAPSPESDYPISKSVAISTAELRAKGENNIDARLLAAARMAELFTRRMSRAYGGGLYRRYSQMAFSQNLAKMDAVTLPRPSDVNALRDNPIAGRFSRRLESGGEANHQQREPLFVSDLRNLTKIDLQSAEKMLPMELRTRYFNPKWLQENQAHGYDALGCRLSRIPICTESEAEPN